MINKIFFKFRWYYNIYVITKLLGVNRITPKSRPFFKVAVTFFNTPQRSSANKIIVILPNFLFLRGHIINSVIISNNLIATPTKGHSKLMDCRKPEVQSLDAFSIAKSSMFSLNWVTCFFIRSVFMDRIKVCALFTFKLHIHLISNSSSDNYHL